MTYDILSFNSDRCSSFYLFNCLCFLAFCSFVSWFNRNDRRDVKGIFMSINYCTVYFLAADKKTLIPPRIKRLTEHLPSPLPQPKLCASLNQPRCRTPSSRCIQRICTSPGCRRESPCEGPTVLEQPNYERS